ncbi:hypothetical protein [Streptomyces cacaoi]|uniref:hypothetical protein n=1 Tax=Streptomyces cacaoi TaxID=1898 RepID=UPI00261DB16E|nr:hypothetical protein [Streptomyces cacaoi]
MTETPEPHRPPSTPGTPSTPAASGTSTAHPEPGAPAPPGGPAPPAPPGGPAPPGSPGGPDSPGTSAEPTEPAEPAEPAAPDAPTAPDDPEYARLREQALALRRAGLSRRRIRDRLKIGNNDLLGRLLRGEPPPAWTRRPNAKDDLRARARELRLLGWTYDRIELELGVSRSSVSLWVRDLPRPKPRYTPEEQRALMREGLAEQRRARDRLREETRQRAREEIGPLTDRELFLVGVGLYWAEGSKSKPYRREENVVFVNSDPDMIRLYLAWLDLLGMERDRLRFTVMIHESADVRAAERYWADLAAVGPESFNKTTLKRHNPRTVRKNTGENYRGCLVVRVRQGAELYRRIEGWWYGIVLGIDSAAEAGCPN